LDILRTKDIQVGTNATVLVLRNLSISQNSINVQGPKEVLLLFFFCWFGFLFFFSYSPYMQAFWDTVVVNGQEQNFLSNTKIGDLKSWKFFGGQKLCLGKG